MNRIPGDPTLYDDYRARFLERRRRLLAADPQLAIRVAVADWHRAAAAFRHALSDVAADFAVAMAPLVDAVAALDETWEYHLPAKAQRPMTAELTITAAKGE